MKRRTATRTVVVTMGLLSLAACIVNLSFDMQKSVHVQTTVGGAVAEQDVLVNLSDYKEITDHKDSVDSFSFDSVDATVTAINAANNTAKHVSGTLALRQTLTDTAHDVPVGSINNPAQLAVGWTQNIKGNAALDAFLLQQIKGAGSGGSAGTFYAVITNGAVDGVADLVLSLTLHVSIGYNAGVL
jgi:hypothetical protein